MARPNSMRTINHIAEGQHEWAPNLGKACIQRNLVQYSDDKGAWGTPHEMLRFCKRNASGLETRVHLTISEPEFVTLFEDAVKKGVFSDSTLNGLREILIRESSIQSQTQAEDQTRVSPDIKYLQAMFGFNASTTHIAVPERGRGSLERMAEDVLSTGQHIAIYIPQGTEEGYQAGTGRGRVVGVVRLLPMPAGRDMTHYTYNDLLGQSRWPYGWPCKPLWAPPADQCPSLKQNFEHLQYEGPFGSYVKPLQMGPFRLDYKMRDQLNDDFSKLPNL